MTTAQAVETSVTVNNSSPIQEYVYLDDQTQPTFTVICSSVGLDTAKKVVTRGQTAALS